MQKFVEQLSAEIHPANDCTVVVTGDRCELAIHYTLDSGFKQLYQVPVAEEDFGNVNKLKTLTRELSAKINRLARSYNERDNSGC